MQPVRRAFDTDIFELGVALATHVQPHVQALLRYLPLTCFLTSWQAFGVPGSS